MKKINLQNNQQCPYCGRFNNRALSVDAIIIKEDKVLLIKRGVEPFKGFWATPGGFVEWNETTEQSVIREVAEETGLKVTEMKLLGINSLPGRHPNQVINLVYLVKVEKNEVTVSDDATAFSWFNLHDLPPSLAFDHKQNILEALKIYDK